MQETGQILDCGFYLPVSMSWNDPVIKFGKGQVIQPNVTGLHRFEHVGQVGQGQGGLQIGLDRMGLGQGGIHIRWDRVGQ